MDLLPQFNPDDYPDSPGYEHSLQMHTPSKVCKCETNKGPAAREVQPITRSMTRFSIPRLLNLSGSVSDHGVELLKNLVRAPVVEQNKLGNLNLMTRQFERIPGQDMTTLN